MFNILQTGIAIAQKFKYNKMPKKIYSEKQWWIPITEIMPGWFIVVKAGTKTPAQVFLTRQSEDDVIYQTEKLENIP